MSDTDANAGAGADTDHDSESPTLGDLLDELKALKATVDSETEREQVDAVIETAVDVKEPTGFGRTVVGFDRADLAEALLGSLLFGIPMMVEGGTQEVGAYIATRPHYLVGTLVFAVGVTISILYIAEFQDVRIHDPFFGFVPRRLAGVVGVAFLVSLVMSTAWGRVDWTNPMLAFSTVSVAFVPMVIGAALGDILPE